MSEQTDADQVGFQTGRNLRMHRSVNSMKPPKATIARTPVVSAITTQTARILVSSLVLGLSDLGPA